MKPVLKKNGGQAAAPRAVRRTAAARRASHSSVPNPVAPESRSMNQAAPLPFAQFDPLTCKSCRSAGNGWIEAWMDWYRE